MLKDLLKIAFFDLLVSNEDRNSNLVTVRQNAKAIICGIPQDWNPDLKLIEAKVDELLGSEWICRVNKTFIEYLKDNICHE